MSLFSLALEQNFAKVLRALMTHLPILVHVAAEYQWLQRNPCYLREDPEYTTLCIYLNRLLTRHEEVSTNIYQHSPLTLSRLITSYSWMKVEA